MGTIERMRVPLLETGLLTCLICGHKWGAYWSPNTRMIQCEECGGCMDREDIIKGKTDAMAETTDGATSPGRSGDQGK